MRLKFGEAWDAASPRVTRGSSLVGPVAGHGGVASPAYAGINSPRPYSPRDAGAPSPAYAGINLFRVPHADSL